MKFCQLVAVLCMFIHLSNAKITLRLRLASGAVSRVEADETENVDSFRARMQSEGKIPVGSSLVIVGKTFQDGSPGEGALGDLGLSNGEIVTVSGGVPQASTSSSPLTKEKEIGGKSSKASQKKSMSNIDIEERRKSLIKIARQKSTGKRYVAVTSSAGRILKRLANSKHGGVALLVGRSMAERNSAAATASKARDRALAKINKKAALEGDRADKGRECIEIHAVFELHAEEGPDGAVQDLATHPSLPRVQKLCSSLGLSVVGVGLSAGFNRKNRDKSLCVWSPNHVHRALQVRSAITSPKVGKKSDAPLFCILSLAASLDVDKEGEINSDGVTQRPVRVDRATRDANPGLVMEAFELSSQALELVDKGVLTLTKLAAPTGAERNGGAKEEVGVEMKTRRRAVINKMNMGAPSTSSSSSSSSKEKSARGSELIQLASAVLTQSDEATAIDPLLLAVPLPIVALDALAPKVKAKADKSVQNRAARGKESKDSPVEWKPETLGVDFEHSFPSPCEMAADKDKVDDVNIHLCDVFEQLSSPSQPRYATMFSRLRDIHLLYYISQYLDVGTMSQLGKILRDSKAATLPHAVKLSMDMLRLSLSSASVGSTRARGKRRVPRITREQRARGETGDDLEEI